MTKSTISTKHLTSFTELSKELNWNTFSINTPDGNKLTKNNFTLIAIGYPNKEFEKWDMEILNNDYSTKEDLIYVLVIENKILKIGKSITTMKKRIQSYHCGKNAYRLKNNSTNSSTNWFILQSVLAIGKPVYIYALYVPNTKGTFMGWVYQNRISKEIENKIISSFSTQYGFKPIGNRQF